MKETLKLALEALQWSKPHEDAVITHGEAINAIKAALAQPEQEPVACVEYIPCCTDQTCPKCKAATPPQPEERNFCSRCGKRTADLTVIHTCTPPQGNT